MKLFDLSDIPNYPGDILLAYSNSSANLTTDILNERERLEYRSFSNKKRKAEFLLGRSLFKFLLRQLDIPPEEVQLYKEEKGKPFGMRGEQAIHVSFTHSGTFVMCAVSTKYVLGLDVETQGRNMDKRVIKRILSEDEWKIIGLEDPLKLWTIKEAALKCSGHGLQSSLQKFVIQQKENGQYFLRFNDEIYIEICSFKAINHQIALAYQSK